MSSQPVSQWGAPRRVHDGHHVLLLGPQLEVHGGGALRRGASPSTAPWGFQLVQKPERRGRGREEVGEERSVIGSRLLVVLSPLFHSTSFPCTIPSPHAVRVSTRPVGFVSSELLGRWDITGSGNRLSHPPNNLRCLTPAVRV